MKAKLNEIASVIPGYSTGRSAPMGPALFKLITAKDIQAGEIGHEGLQDAFTDRPHRIESYRVRAGDLLVVAKGAFKTAVVKDGLPDAVASSNLFIVRPTGAVSAECIKAFLDSPLGQHEVAKRARGSVIFSLNRRDLEDIDIPLLPAADQAKLGALVRASVEWRATAQAAIESRQRLVDETILALFERYPESAT
jgi:hypothetical protein